ncbi:hypothetical protein L1049_013469 [Liquidambar formosana]|uniref:Late embryogenesis abundant protein LEA-2 subgroup domain-containing protein n=1 Tax=Liquidambar formosana TaxID=63359 RepID=A0AAP0WUB3_LIQFO
MEDRRDTVIGYPVEFFRGQSNYQVSHYATTSAAAASTSASATNNNVNTARAHVVQPPTVSHHHQQRPGKSKLSNSCLALIIASISVAVMFVIYAIVSFLNAFEFPEFTLNSVSISPFNLSVHSHTTTTNWNVSFYIRNPNRRMSFSYDMVQASLFYKDAQFLSPGTIPPFSQGTEDSTSVQAKLATSSVYVDDGLRKAILDCWSRRGAAVDLNVKVQALIRFDPGTNSESRGSVWVFCKDVKTEFLSNSTLGTMVGGSMKCKVGVNT